MNKASFPSWRRFAAFVSIAVITAGVGLYFVTGGAPNIYYCDGRSMTASEVAAHRGVTLEMLDLLGANRSLTVSDICTIEQKKLDRAVYRVNNPKPDHPGEWAALRARQMRDENGRIPSDGLLKAAQHVKAMVAYQNSAIQPKQIARTSWRWLGPGNIGGRVRALVIHPTKPATMWLGSVSGGVWRTTNGGATWRLFDNYMGNMAVSTLIMDRKNPDVLYAGTGEGFFKTDPPLQAPRGAGIFKTTDGGISWVPLCDTNKTPNCNPNNANFHYVNRLAIAPNNLIILAATNSGIWRNLNHGAKWTRVGTERATDVKFHPTDNTLAIASGGNGKVWYSTDGGGTWTAATGFPAATAWSDWSNRVELAYAPSNPKIVYASANYKNGQIWKSMNGGQTFTLVNTGQNYLGSQGWYGNAIWVDPINANRLIVGGIDLWRSTNSGSTLTKISKWDAAPLSAHADHHTIVHDPNYNGTSNKTVFFGNDGGIFRANNVLTVSEVSGWQELNNTLGITQFYSAAGDVTTGEIIGGTQDNGTLFYTKANGTEAWRTTFGGDGGFSAASPTNIHVFYGEYVNLRLFRSLDRGVSADYIYAGLTDAETSPACALFIAPFILDPNSSNRILAGGCSLWRSDNAGTAPKPTWSSIKPKNAGKHISAIAVASGNSNIIWVGYDSGDIYRTSNGTVATPTWTKVDTGLPNRYVTRIAIGTNPNTAYATFGGFSADNVWRTTNNGASWTKITGTGATALPAAPVRSIVVHPYHANWLYVGTEVGVFVSEDGGGTWVVPQSGPTNTSVDELFWMNTAIVAATHGRGIFKSETLPCVTLTTAISPAGRGTIAANPVPNCVTGTGNYAYGSSIKLTATAANGYVFDHWSGASSSTNQAITVKVVGNKSVTANFVAATPPVLSIAALDADKSEGNSGATPFTFTIGRSGNTNSTNAVTWAVGAGASPTASSNDFVGGTYPSGTVTFAPAETASKTITVNVQGDTDFESDENFVVSLSNPTGGAVLDSSKTSANGTIRNDDSSGGESFQGIDAHTDATAVSADGTVVVGVRYFSSSTREAFRWANGTMTGLGFLPGGTVSVASAVNSNGTVIVGAASRYDSTSKTEAFRWANGTMTGLGFLPGHVFSTARGVSTDGSIVVGASCSDQFGFSCQAFRWTASGGMTGLDFLPGDGISSASGVSADGTVVVGTSSQSPTSWGQAFRWVSGTMTGLGFLPGYTDGSVASHVSGDGSVVVGGSLDRFTKWQPFRWVNGTMIGLGFLAGRSSSARAVNSNGTVVVGGNSDGMGGAFRWTEADGMQSVTNLLTAAGISLNNWSLRPVTGISADGTVIVGTADFYTPSGYQSRGWIARLPLPAGLQMTPAKTIATSGR